MSHKVIKRPLVSDQASRLMSSLTGELLVNLGCRVLASPKSLNSWPTNGRRIRPLVSSVVVRNRCRDHPTAPLEN